MEASFFVCGQEGLFDPGSHRRSRTQFPVWNRLGCEIDDVDWSETVSGQRFEVPATGVNPAGVVLVYLANRLRGLSHDVVVASGDADVASTILQESRELGEEAEQIDVHRRLIGPDAPIRPIREAG